MSGTHFVSEYAIFRTVTAALSFRKRPKKALKHDRSLKCNVNNKNIISITIPPKTYQLHFILSNSLQFDNNYTGYTKGK